MKLARSRPWRSRSASHSQSFTSVLRPGTALMWRGVDQQEARTGPPAGSTPASSRPRSISIATWVTRPPPSQSAKLEQVLASSSRRSESPCWAGSPCPGRSDRRRPCAYGHPARSTAHAELPSATPPIRDRRSGMPLVCRFWSACFPTGSNTRWCLGASRSTSERARSTNEKPTIFSSAYRPA